MFNKNKGQRKSNYLSKPRIPPLEESKWDDDARNLIEGWRKLNKTKGVINILATMANYSKLYNRWRVFGNHVLYKSSLPIREKEILILRTGWLCNSKYEWAQHSLIAKRFGLSEEEILQIKEGPDAEGWNSLESTLLRAADELYIDSIISNATWEELSKTYSPQQLMDVVFTVGQYTLTAMALNSLGIQLEDGMKDFPEF
ncbi:MAG: carboxymuconolactone decarboxylase family protein [Candidatus Lokiarchaeota archaeon]|nr:carboxymuconolactone decarboxylase family protein [Candidatus Lokiarchaeota archaeon]